MRKEMVERQIIERGVRDSKVIKAMIKVPRHKFLPPEYADQSFIDGPLPIGEKQTISQPYIVAYMTEALKLKSSDKVLEIGTGSGFQTAVLAEIANRVYTIEIIESLGQKAKKLLEELGYRNIHFKIGDGCFGWKEHGPYDAIIVTSVSAQIPKELINQLAEGGRMVIPVGGVAQKLVMIERKSGKIIQKQDIPVRFVPMTGEVEK